MFRNLRRMVARTLRASAEAIAPAYPSTGSGRRTAGLRRVSGAGPNAVVAGNVPLLRQQSRQIVRSNPHAGVTVDLAATHIVSTGIKPQSLCPDAGFRADLQAAWYDWTDRADADGVLDFYGLQALAVREWFEGGEGFGQMLFAGDLGMDVPLQIRLLESEQCPLTGIGGLPTSLPAGHTVTHGIQRDAARRRVAYWFHQQHPGDSVVEMALDAGLLVPVPAADILHLYHPVRAGQLRGIPMLARQIVALSQVEDYQDAERERKKTAAMRMGAIFRRAGGDDEDSEIGEGEADADGVASVDMEPATMLVLDDGTDVKWFDPVDVGGSYEPFLRSQYQAVAASAGMMYEEVTGDYRGMNDRVFRAAFNTFKRRARFWQHNIVAVQFCTPVWHRFIDYALLSGRLTRPRGLSDRDLRRVAWTPDAWEYLHPVQDVQSKKAMVDAGFTSRAAVVSELGYDVEDVDRQRRDDAARERAMGLTPAPPPGPPVPAPSENARQKEAVKNQRPFDGAGDIEARVYVRDSKGRFANVPGISDSLFAAWVLSLNKRRKPGERTVRYRHAVREIGSVDRDISRKLRREGISLTGRKLLCTAQQVDHLTRPGSKADRGASLTVAEVSALPALLRGKKAVMVEVRAGKVMTNGFYIAAPLPGRKEYARIFVKTDAHITFPRKSGGKRQNAKANVTWSTSAVQKSDLQNKGQYRIVWGRL